MGLNRTFMELKFAILPRQRASVICLNRTFMELKSLKDESVFDNLYV